MAHEPDATRRAARFWEQSHADESPADSFLEHPLIQAYLSLRAFGSTRAHMDVAIAEIDKRTRPGARVLSVGCGPAQKEMAICNALPDRTLVGIDITDDTLARARDEAARRGLANLELTRGDFNALELEPGSFDLIVGLGAIHHVEKLEGFWAQCKRALRPGGSILAQEYVGPNRFQWTDEQIALADEMLRTLVPAEHQVHHTRVERVPVAELIAVDPSEAVRSEEIVSTCRAAGLSIESYFGGGCSLLQPALMNQIHTFDPLDWVHNDVLFTLFREEDRYMRERELGDSYAMFVAA